MIKTLNDQILILEEQLKLLKEKQTLQLSRNKELLNNEIKKTFNLKRLTIGECNKYYEHFEGVVKYPEDEEEYLRRFNYEVNTGKIWAKYDDRISFTGYTVEKVENSSKYTLEIYESSCPLHIYDELYDDFVNYFNNRDKIRTYIQKRREFYAIYDVSIIKYNIYYLIAHWRSSLIPQFCKIPKDVMKIICLKVLYP